VSVNRLTAEFASQKSVDEVVTRFSAAKAKPVRNWSESLRRGSKTRLAELVAAIEYYERTGQSLPGYDISG
jgi:hypothetical protein